MRQSVLIVISTGKLGIEMPHRNLLVMEGTYYRYMYLQHRGEAGTIPLYVGIIHVPLHRLGRRIGHHYQLPVGAIQWVTDMLICG